MKKLIESQKFLHFCQKYLGISIVKHDYYSVVPDTEDINSWYEHYQRCNFNILNLKKMEDFGREVIKAYEAWFTPADYSPTHSLKYFSKNQMFGLTSAKTLFSIIGHFKPERIIEVGSGYSTLVMREALEYFDATDICILNSFDPHPPLFMDSKVHKQDSRYITTWEFAELQVNDILFIDTTHVVRTGGEVNNLILEILPQLHKGVLVHFHDIFYPYEYPKEWLLRNRFWNEQYLLQAFLVNNKSYEVLWAENYMREAKLDSFNRCFRDTATVEFERNYYSSSFWIRKLK